MTPEQTLQKAIEIAQNNGREYKQFLLCINRKHNNVKGAELYPYYPKDSILFDKWFRKALVGETPYLYPDATEFSSTWEIVMRWNLHIAVEMYPADYHLMMCAKSDDRLKYLEQVLLYLERK